MGREALPQVLLSFVEVYSTIYIDLQSSFFPNYCFPTIVRFGDDATHRNIERREDQLGETRCLCHFLPSHIDFDCAVTAFPRVRDLEAGGVTAAKRDGLATGIVHRNGGDGTFARAVGGCFEKRDGYL